MNQIPGFTLFDKIEETRGSLVYRAARDESGEKVVVKFLKTSNPTQAELVRFRQEYELIKNINLEGVLKTFEIVNHLDGLALILEDFSGISLKRIFQHQKPTIEAFLRMAVDIAQTLGSLHRMNIVHLDITPNNILMNPQTESIRITDFGISAALTHANEEIYKHEVMQGALAYISPEQTGRMNRAVDYRSDLYSLGVTFYELLTGSLPFMSDDPMEIIHAHIAKTPASPSSVNASIPQILSDIILKLMAKTAEDRYQNAFGLVADLQECVRRLAGAGVIDHFELAQNDHSFRFNAPQKLYGREREVAALMAAFERTKSRRTELMLVTGSPGIGKSALINEIHKPVLASKGFFIYGKYEQFRRDVPYSSIIQAFQRLIRQLLAQDQERVSVWARQIQDALGANGKVITELIPTLELIIGKQPELIELGPEEAHNRVNHVFRNFIPIFARPEHPLVLFLDDLQWADNASLLLMRSILTNLESKNLLLIGSYRDNEVSASHPLVSVLDDLKKAQVPIDQISLHPLDAAHVTALIGDVLNADADKTRLLAAVVHAKTSGNPFFVSQFMKMLYDERMIEQDPACGWQWDLARIKGMQVTDNVLDLMSAKISKLPLGTRELLRICACFGNRFELESLSSVAGTSLAQTLEDISFAIDEGLIGLNQEFYKFQHDRIQEAAYSQLAQDKKIELHYRIGKLALQSVSPEILKERIFYVVNQLNLAHSLVQNGDEKVQLLHLNLAAGRKARSSAAYQQAFHYYKFAIGLLDPDGWATDYDTSLALFNEGAETAYLCGEFVEMEQMAAQVLSHAKTILDKVKIYKVKMDTHIALGDPRASVDTALEILRQLNIRFPKKPTMAHVALEVVKSKIFLLGKRIEDLAQLPQAKDPYALAAIGILAPVCAAAYLVMPKLVYLIIVKLLRLSATYGLTTHTPYAFAMFGGVMVAISDFETGYRFGKLLQKLLSFERSGEQQAKVSSYLCIYVMHWKEHVRDTLPVLKNGHTASLDLGDFEFAGYSCVVYSYHALYSGSNLAVLEQEISRYLEVMSSSKQRTSNDLLRMNHQLVLNLLGRSQVAHKLNGPSYNEDDNKPIASFQVYKLQLCYLLGQFEEALISGNWLARRIRGIANTYHLPEFRFYDSLNRLALCGPQRTPGRDRLLSEVAKNQKALNSFAAFGPVNHRHRHTLVQAELAGINGDHDKAMLLYETAIKQAHENRFVQDEAIACELAAAGCLRRGMERMARAYLQEAHAGFARWGAVVKVRQLEERYSEWLAVPSRNYSMGDTTLSSTGGMSAFRIDLGTLKKSLKIIAEEKVHSKMIEKTVRTAIEFAGAQKGVLILKKAAGGRDGAILAIEAEGYVDCPDVSILQSQPVEESRSLSLSVVNYVARSMDPVVVHNALEPQEKIPQLEADFYIRDGRVKSILCLPILTGLTGEMNLVGLLYLENNLATHVFTEERIETLEIICLSAAGRLELSRKASTDGLTGLYNHDYFQSALQHEMLLSRRGNRKLSLLMIDIDHFKKFNDTWGHQLGDLVLAEVASCIRKSCRKSDVVARYGGEEMSVILPDSAGEATFDVAEKIRKAIEALEMVYKDQALRVTVSIGLSSFPMDGSDPISLIGKADQALYESKHNGRNRVSRSVPYSG